MRTTYTFKEEVNIKELATRIINTADLFTVRDVFGSVEAATEEIANDLINNPLAIIISLVEQIEELQQED